MTAALAWRMPSHPQVRKWVNTAVGLAGENLNIDTRLRACSNSAIFHIWMGDYAECRILIEQMRKMVQSRPASPAREIVLRIAEAMSYNASSEFHANAGQSISQGLETARKSGVHVMDTLLYLQGVANALNEGDKDRAHEFLLKMEKTLSGDRRAHSAHYFYFLSWYFVLINDLPQAVASAKESLRLIREAGLPVSETLIRLALALVLNQSGNREEACRQQETAQGISAATGSSYCAYLCDLAGAYLSFVTGKIQEGLSSLQNALHMGRRKGYVTTLYFWRADILADLCLRALEAGIEVEFVRELIRKLKLNPPATPFTEGEMGGILMEAWPWPVRISTLGTFELMIDGKTVTYSGKSQKKPLLLLKALIALGPQDVRQEDLANILWPDADGDSALNAMKTTIARLRQMIGNDAAIQVRQGRLSLDNRYCWVDIRAFERLCSRAEQIEIRRSVPAAQNNSPVAPEGVLRSGSADPEFHVADEMTPLRQIVSKVFSLYGGPFLHSETDQNWTVTARERLRSRYLRLISRVARLCEQTGRHEEAAEYYLKGLETEPLAEEFHQGLMTSYIHLSRRAEALSAYKRCKEVLQAELGITPSGKTEALRAEILKSHPS